MSEQDCNFEKLCELIDRHKFVSFNDFLFYLKSVKNQDAFKSYVDKVNKVDDDTYEFFM